MGWTDKVYDITSSQVDEMAKTAVIIIGIVVYSGVVFRFCRLLAKRAMVSCGELGVSKSPLFCM